MEDQLNIHPALAGLAPGDVVHGQRYRLIRQLGRGGMGVVWEAVYRPHGEAAVFALKFIPLRRDPVAGVDVFPREALVSVVHPHIARVHECFRLNDDVQVIRMDLLRGETLSAHLSSSRRLALAEIATIVGQTASALGTAHAHGVVHRDIKPSNLFLQRDEDNGVSVRVLDFGIARLIGGAVVPTQLLTRTEGGLGTPGYTAPEQLRNARLAGPPADVWSLGVVLFECLFGTLPFPEHSDIELWVASASTPDLLRTSAAYPSDVLDLAARMLSHDPAARPASCDILDLLSRHTTADLGEIGVPLHPGVLSTPSKAPDPGDSATDTGGRATATAQQTHPSTHSAPLDRSRPSGLPPEHETLPEVPPDRATPPVTHSPAPMSIEPALILPAASAKPAAAGAPRRGPWLALGLAVAIAAIAAARLRAPAAPAPSPPSEHHADAPPADAHPEQPVQVEASTAPAPTPPAAAAPPSASADATPPAKPPQSPRPRPTTSASAVASTAPTSAPAPPPTTPASPEATPAPPPPPKDTKNNPNARAIDPKSFTLQPK